MSRPRDNKATKPVPEPFRPPLAIRVDYADGRITTMRFGGRQAEAAGRFLADLVRHFMDPACKPALERVTVARPGPLARWHKEAGESGKRRRYK